MENDLRNNEADNFEVPRSNAEPRMNQTIRPASASEADIPIIRNKKIQLPIDLYKHLKSHNINVYGNIYNDDDDDEDDDDDYRDVEEKRLKPDVLYIREQRRSRKKHRPPPPTLLSRHRALAESGPFSLTRQLVHLPVSSSAPMECILYYTEYLLVNGHVEVC